MLRGPSGFCPQFTAEHSGIVRAGKLNDSDLDHKDRGANCTTGPLKFFYLTELFGPVAVVTKPQAQRPLFRGRRAGAILDSDLRRTRRDCCRSSGVCWTNATHDLGAMLSLNHSQE